MKDYNVTIKVRNNRLLAKMRQHGHFTVASLSRACGIKQSELGMFLNLKRQPMRDDGNWLPSVHKVADTLFCSPEDLFPERHYRDVLEKNTAECEMAYEEMAVIAGPVKTPEQIAMIHEAESAIDHALNCLTPRETRVMNLRYQEDKTLDEIANIIGVHLERVRQIEMKSLRKLRNPKISNDLKQHYHAFGN